MTERSVPLNDENNAGDFENTIKIKSMSKENITIIAVYFRYFEPASVIGEHSMRMSALHASQLSVLNSRITSRLQSGVAGERD